MKLYIVGFSFATSLFLSPLFCLSYGSCMLYFYYLSQVKNKIVREVIDFVKSHQSTFYQILKEDVSGANELALERVTLVVSVLSKVLFSLGCFNDVPTFLEDLFPSLFLGNAINSLGIFYAGLAI